MPETNPEAARHFVRLGENGEALAFYDTALSPEIPQDATPITEATWLGWLADTAGQRLVGGVLTPVPPPPAPPKERKLAPLSFRRRLPPTVRGAVTLAASRAMEAGDPSLQMFLDDLAASRVVDLDSPDLIAGVSAMQEAGLLTAAQHTTLLADPRPDEL